MKKLLVDLLHLMSEGQSSNALDKTVVGELVANGFFFHLCPEKKKKKDLRSSQCSITIKIHFKSPKQN